MMKDIQEKRIENELNLIKNSSIPSKFKKINKEEYQIEVTLPFKMIESDLITNDIVFLIQMVANFPFNQPKVYCKTPFSFPIICDGRDILEDIIGQNWVTSLKLIDIINKMPEFAIDFVKQLQQGVIVLVGNYYLGEIYDLSFLESLPIYIRKAKEKVFIDNKVKEIPKLLMVSDVFFCLFDQEKWNKNNLNLTFWTNIRSLVTIKKMIKGDTCRFFWKQRNKKKHYEMILTIENSNELVNLMLDKMSKFGINYKVSKHNLEPKQGQIPAIDIETVEKNISECEARLEDNPDIELIQYLMNLYEKAVEYYSATNNPKYEYYTSKIHSTLQNPRIKDFLDHQKQIIHQGIAQNIQEDDSEDNMEGNTEKKSNSNKILYYVNPVENFEEIPKKLRIRHIDVEEGFNYTQDLNNEPPEIRKSDIEFNNTFKNEEKGIKLVISYDENEKLEFSDDDDDDD